MRVDVLTIFPDFFVSPLAEGIVRRAREERIIEVCLHNIRDHARDKHRSTDDRPYGGGEGMVMRPEPLAACLKSIGRLPGVSRVVLMSPRGQRFTQQSASRFASYDQLLLVCGRYEGVDERFARAYVDENCSIGDYILSGGELAALVIIDAVTRLLPGALGCEDSAKQDTFSRNLLKHHHYTRPALFESQAVPSILLSGDHGAVRKYRFIESVRLTLERRPEMLAVVAFTKEERRWLHEQGLLEKIMAVTKSPDGKDASNSST